VEHLLSQQFHLLPELAEFQLLFVCLGAGLARLDQGNDRADNEPRQEQE
jgi:hypothetical protein